MKLLVFDVDDTLLAADKVFRQSTINSLNERLEKGDAIAIASGRPYIGIMQFLNKLEDGKKFPIAANGAAVYDLAGHCLHSDALRYQDFLTFYHEHQSILKEGGSMYCYTLDAVGYFEMSYFINFEVTWNGLPARNLLQNPLGNDDPILKIMVTFNNGRWDCLKLSEAETKKYHIIRSDPRFLEFMNPGVDKATGVEFLRQYLKVDKSDVYCFGDQGNDVGMISAYQGVAMDNAIPEAKKVAKFVTLSAEEDGVSYALHHFVK
jgi:Cof subfamily protein (haloacid dehalogenase superfamily)